jgi:capsular polysaccharide transport system permease protein
MLWRNAGIRCSKAIEPNLALLYHRHVRVIDLFLSRAILEIAGGTISAIFVGLGLVATGMMEMPRDIVLMLCAWLLLMWFTIGIGFLVGAFSERTEVFDRLYHPFLYFYLPVSGAFYMVDWLPTYLQKFVVWIPTVTITEMLRHGYWGTSVHTYEKPAYVSVLSLVLMLAGLLLARDAKNRIGK